MLIIQIFSQLLGYSLACLGAGVLILNIIAKRSNSIQSASPGTLLASAFILGQGILASLWLLLALKGWFSPSLVLGISLICILVGIFLGRGLFVAFGQQVSSLWRELRQEPWGWQVIVALTILLCLAWVTSIGRPFEGDSAAFYMALPKVIASSHRLVPLPGYDNYTNIGLQAELHYAVFMAFDDLDAARLFAWPTILAGAVMLLAIGKQIGLGQRGQWIALALIFSSSAIIYLSGDGKADLFAAAPGLAAYYWILRTHDCKKMALWLTGFFSGFAIAAKLSYIVVMAPGLVLLLFWTFREKLLDKNGRKEFLLVISVAGIQIFAALLISIAPQLIKNTLLYHNPIAPFGTDGIGWAKQIWFGPETTRRIVLTYPFALVFGDYWGQYGTLSPLVMAFLPLAIFLPKSRQTLLSPLVVVTLSAAVGLLLWIVTQPSVLAPRYILATLLLFVLLPARAVEYVSKNDRHSRWLNTGIIVCMIVTILAGLHFSEIIFLPRVTFAYLTEKINECDRDGAYCQVSTFINHQAQAGDRVYLATYYRYWLRPDLLQCANTISDSKIFQSKHTSAERWASFYEQGFRFLMVDRKTHSAFLEKFPLENPPAWLKPTILYQEGSLEIYQLDFKNPPTSPLKTCRLVHPPAWDVVDR
jgi:hypothetical protein